MQNWPTKIFWILFSRSVSIDSEFCAVLHCLQYLFFISKSSSINQQTWYFSIFFYTAGFSATNFTQWKCIICVIIHSRLNSVNALTISYLGFFIRNELNSRISTVLRKKTHKNLCDNFATKYVVFWRNLHRLQKNYTSAGSDARDKSLNISYMISVLNIADVQDWSVAQI